MKICLLTHTLPRFEGDPSAPFIHTLIESLVKQNNKVTVLAPYNTKFDLKYKRIYKLITYKYINPKSLHTLGYSQTLKGDKSMSLISYILSPFFYIFGFIALLKLVKKEKIDIISAHWILPNGFIAAIVSKITKIPFTVTIPGSDVYMASKNSFFRWMAKVASDSASWVISDSQHYLRQLNDLKIYPSKTKVIRYGVDMSKYNLSNNTSKELSTILAIGRFVAKKGFKYLIKAMPKIVKNIPQTNLVIIGDGDERNNLEKLVTKLKLTQKVSFPGMVSYAKLSEYFSIAQVFVMPSVKDEEGNIDASPVAMMDAMASGLPVVATDLAGDDDLIIDGETGYLIKQKSSQAISDSIIKLLKKGISVNMHKNIRKIAQDNFSSSVIAKKYTNCFNDSILL